MKDKINEIFTEQKDIIDRSISQLTDIDTNSDRLEITGRVGRCLDIIESVKLAAHKLYRIQLLSKLSIEDLIKILELHTTIAKAYNQINYIIGKGVIEVTPEEDEFLIALYNDLTASHEDKKNNFLV